MSKTGVTSFVVAFGLLAVPAAALAQSRPSSPSLSCAQARQLVLSQGAVVLGTGGFTYDRYVRDGSFCERGEYPSSAWVPTRDTPQCPVGYRCRSGPSNEFGD